MELKYLNPWWENKHSIHEDKHIKDLSGLKYTHIPNLLNYNFKLGNVYTIRGPRQIGKTTLLKLLIRKKLEFEPPQSIFYWSCDNLNNHQELIELLKDYSDFCKVNDISPKYILLDEITFVKNWQMAIKFVIDNNILGKVCFILTGSNIIDLKKGVERLPGRRGKDGKDLFHMPLDFREYVKLISPEFFEKHKEDSLEKLKFSSDQLKILFQKFLKTGGIPLVINEYEKHNTVPQYIYELYYSWIVGDVLKEGKNEQTLREIIKSVLITYTSSTSWENLSKKCNVKSHLTVSSYVELLSNLLVLFPAYFKDINQNKTLYKKNKKLYFYDIFILYMFSKFLYMDLEEAQIVEGIVGSYIKQKNILEDINFTNLKKETDFIIEDVGIEVKYQNKIKKEDFYNNRYFKDYVVLSKDTKEDKVLPVHLYLFKGNFRH